LSSLQESFPDVFVAVSVSLYRQLKACYRFAERRNVERFGTSKWQRNCNLGVNQRLPRRGHPSSPSLGSTACGRSTSNNQSLSFSSHRIQVVVSMSNV